MSTTRRFFGVVMALGLGAAATGCKSSTETANPTNTDAVTSKDTAAGDATPVDAASDTAAPPADSATDSTGDAGSETVTSTDPGALVEVTFTAQVGVLLDEIPEAERERVITKLMAEPDAFWIERARRQVELTHYRLTFRAFYYEEEVGALNLPPPQVWQFTLDGKPARTKIGTHDVLAVKYSYLSRILSDVASVAVSDPELGTVGNAVEESFELPVDPELVLQRTGYACIDEAEFPPGSVDAESVATYYDDTCMAKEDPTIDPKSRCHQQLPLPTEDCVAALDAHIGRVTVAMTFERIAWDEALAKPFRVNGWTSETGTDVQPVTEALDNNYIVYRYVSKTSCEMIEKCVGDSGWRRLLRFDAFLKNTGKKDMEIGDVDYFIEDPTGKNTTLGQHHIFEYSECHDHYHFTHYGQFDLVIGDKTVVGSKRAFCLETGTRHFNDEFTTTTTDFSGCHYQGLTKGWGDEYGASLDCQWFDVTGVDTSKGEVAAKIRFSANPDGFLCEGNPVLDEAGQLKFTPTDFKTEDGKPVDKPLCDYIPDWQKNNQGERPTTLPKSGGYVTAKCTRGQIGPLRDCGFTELALEDCKPGEKVERKVSVKAGGAQNVVRICEASLVLGVGTACTKVDALANGIVGTTETTLSFTCPAARDSKELGGKIAWYAAPLVEGDALGELVK